MSKGTERRLAELEKVHAVNLPTVAICGPDEEPLAMIDEYGSRLVDATGESHTGGACDNHAF